MSCEQFSRKLQSIPALREEGGRLIRQAVQREPAKVIALRTGMTPRQVYNHREQECEPRWPAFLMLARSDPALRAWVLRQLDHQDDPTRALAVIAAELARRR